MAVSYSDAFKRQVRRLSRRYRRIRSDIQPVIDQLTTGETPGDRIQRLGHTVYTVRTPNTDTRRGKSGEYRIIYHVNSEDDVLLVAIYSKSEQADIEPGDMLRIIRDEEFK